LINFVVIQTPHDPNDFYQIFYTEKSFKASIFIDGKRISKSTIHEIVQKSVPSGKHKITTSWGGWGALKNHATFNFEAGKTYYFGIGVGSIKGKIVDFGFRASLTTLSKEEWEEYTLQ
tara:strand:+ start:100 stop:453 length:354 start_codon:yes stop_codon:yes gene_type:complete